MKMVKTPSYSKFNIYLLMQVKSFHHNKNCFEKHSSQRGLSNSSLSTGRKT